MQMSHGPMSEWLPEIKKKKLTSLRLCLLVFALALF